VLIIITQKQLSVLAIDQIVMVGSPRIMRTLAAIFAVQLLQTASAEVAEEVCAPTSVKGAGDYEECVPSPKRGAELIQTAKRAALAGQGQSDDRWSTRGRTSPLYCYQNDRLTTGKQSACWEEKPSPDTTPECTPDSGETPCRCKTAECRFDLLSSSPPTTAKCAPGSKAFFIFDGTFTSKRGDYKQIRGTGYEMYCKKMVKFTEYNEIHLFKRHDDPPQQYDYWRVNCWGSYMWEDDACYRAIRYLGEKCWGDWDCAGYVKAKTACGGGKCVPKGFEPRKPCECATSASRDTLACNSKSCAPFACLMNLEDNTRYCDLDSGGWA